MLGGMGVIRVLPFPSASASGGEKTGKGRTRASAGVLLREVEKGVVRLAHEWAVLVVTERERERERASWVRFGQRRYANGILLSAPILSLWLGLAYLGSQFFQKCRRERTAPRHEITKPVGGLSVHGSCLFPQTSLYRAVSTLFIVHEASYRTLWPMPGVVHSIHT